MSDPDALLDWYDRNARDLPWRRFKDPYAIWVSEIMLQQTQVGTVIPYWERWMKRFPTVDSLADAGEDEIMALWQGLGYYRRARHLLSGARFVSSHGLPSSASGWRQVPGVGRYTAGAIASIASNQIEPLVDGNVERVYARLTADQAVGPVLNRRAWSWAAAVIHKDRPGDWNQALMELGATLCKPKDPECQRCPVAGSCEAHRLGKAGEFPRRDLKTATIELPMRIIVPVANGLIGVRRVPEGEWWHGTWDFPRGDHDDVAGEASTEIGKIRHQVTHHRISAYVVVIQGTRCGVEWKRRSELEAIAMSSLARKVLKKLDAHAIAASLEK